MEGAWVDRLEKRFGFLAAPGLPTFITGMTVVCGLLASFKPEFVDALALDPTFLLRGQVWRAFTFLVVPPPAGPLWLVLWILMLYSILHALETAWGDFKFTVFLAVGLIATAIGSIAVRAQFGNEYLILACFLAFARLMPEREILVMFVLPVKLRWLAVLASLWAALSFATSGIAGQAWIASGLAPYILFFGPGHWRELAWAWRRWRGGR